MDYDELTLTIRSVEDGYRVSARSDLFKQEAEQPFEPPVTPEELEELVDRVSTAVNRELGARAGTGSGRGEGAEARSQPAPREIGEQLQGALFCGEVGAMLERASTAVAEKADTGLRLRLVFDAAEDPPRLAFLTRLPWELMWHPKLRFIGRRASTPIVRDLASGQRVTPLTTHLPLRILIVDSGASNLKLHLERLRIQRALEGDSRFELFVLDRPTIADVRRALKADRIHVLHFMGHGGYSNKSGRGAIFFVDPSGEEKIVLGEVLAEHLMDLPDLRLVVLNTCRSAMLNGPEGVASARLVRENPPAIVAMQFPISDTAATAFSRSFYGALAMGDPLDAAVTEARLALSAETPEWVTAVLYMPSEDGVLFRIEGAEPPRKARAIPIDELDRTPLHLAIHSIGGFGEVERFDAGRLLKLLKHFQAPTHRHLVPDATWEHDLFAPLATFLLDAEVEGRPLTLDLTCHATLAFAAGRILAKSGRPIELIQRSQGETRLLRENEGPPGAEPFWEVERDDLRSDGSRDVALAVSVVADSYRDVGAYLERSGIEVHRLIHAKTPVLGPKAMLGGSHAVQLAAALAELVRDRTDEERQGVLHLFGAAPNTLWFLLGRRSLPFGTVQLYEYDYDAERQFASYTPSLRLPVAG